MSTIKHEFGQVLEGPEKRVSVQASVAPRRWGAFLSVTRKRGVYLKGLLHKSVFFCAILQMCFLQAMLAGKNAQKRTT